MKRRITTILSMLILLALLAAPVAAEQTAQPSPRAYLPVVNAPAAGPNRAVVQTDNIGGADPGDPITFEQAVPINIVFIGFQNRHILRPTLAKTLPATYTPIVRYPPFYGLQGRDMGLMFKFKYNLIYPDPAYEQEFFSFLAEIGEPGDPTVFQEDYNAQENNVLDVTGPVLYIDAPSVEQWLWDNSQHLLGGKANHSYTVYFINWFDRPDFQFHVYTRNGNPDPDTGYDFGLLRDSRKLDSWGGSYSRAWFNDLSAGPVAWSDNWNVDNPDLDGDGSEEYRMPPIWEYTFGGYRTPNLLTRDLGLITRFVAINLLFTPSPLYDPMVTAPGLGGQKVTHLEMFQDDPASDGMDWISSDFVYDHLSGFQPYYDWTVSLENNDPIDPAAERAYRIWAEILVEDDCWNPYGSPFAELFCYFDANLASYVPSYAPNDYVGEIFAFNTTADNMGTGFGLLGFADDNWVDGTQSYVFEFDTDYYRSIGYGFSTTSVHEFGHHVGMSHPHDGYDAETGQDYGPSGPFYFAWLGDESNTIMHYMDLSYDFGQFGEDNMYRYEFAGYLNWTNALLDDVLADPDVGTVQLLVDESLMHAGLAESAFYEWDYLSAATHARLAWEKITEAATILGIPLPSKPVQTLTPNPNVPHEGDPIRFPDN